MRVDRFAMTIIFSAILCVHARAADRWDVELPLWKRTAVGSATRSLLVPGWGQFRNRQWTKSGTFFVFAVGSAAGAFYLDHNARRSYEDYRLTGDPDNAAYDRYQRQHNLSKIFGVASISLWTAAVVDAYIQGKRMERLYRTEARAPSFEVVLLPTGASASWRFGGHYDD